MQLDPKTGVLNQATWCESPNCDEREHATEPDCIIIHCISLPPGEYGRGAVQRFFKNELSPNEHPYYKSMAHLTVSAHFFIERVGAITQFVSTNKRAWHAGESFCLGRPKVNDFSVGIELEGLDTDVNGFTRAQYSALGELIAALKKSYPRIKDTNLFAHSDIAPGRKPDPGPYFDWNQALK